MGKVWSQLGRKKEKPREEVLVFHCAEDQTLADDLCQFLDLNDILTIAAHEEAFDPFGIDTSDDEYSRSSIRLTTKLLLLITDRSPQTHIDVVRKVLDFHHLNFKTYLLCCHGYLPDMQIQSKGDYFLRYTDRAMLHIDALAFLQNPRGLELSKESFKRKHIKSKLFKFICICLVGPGLFVLGSNFPSQLTLFDTTEMKPVTQLDLQLGAQPIDVCLIPGDKVAITCEWWGTIVIVSVKNKQLHREHAIHIDSRPMCITSYKDDLFVVTGNVETKQVSISRVTRSGDRHVVCDLSEWRRFDLPGWYSMTTSKECEPKIYVTQYGRSDILEVSFDGCTFRYISMPHTEGYMSTNVVSVGENTLCLFSDGNNLLLADIKSENTLVYMKQKIAYRCNEAYVCPVTKTFLIFDALKGKIKVFK